MKPLWISSKSCSALSAFFAIISIEKFSASGCVKSTFGCIAGTVCDCSACSTAMPLSSFTLAVPAKAEIFFASASDNSPVSTITEMIVSLGKVFNCGFARRYEFILSSIVLAILKPFTHVHSYISYIGKDWLLL